MSLSAKVTATLTALVLAWILVGSAVQQYVFHNMFADLERQAALEDMRRVQGAIDDDVQRVAEIAERYAGSPSVAQLVAGNDSDAYAAQLLDAASMQSEHVDFLFFYRSDRAVVAGRVLDPITGQPTELASPDTAIVQAAVVNAAEGRDRAAGLLAMQREPLLVATRRVPATAEGAAGLVVVGRFLDRELTQQLSQRCEVQFDAWPIDARDRMPATVSALVDSVRGSDEPVVLDPAPAVEGDSIAAVAALDDVNGHAQFIVRAIASKDITTAGSSAAWFSAIATGTLGLALLLALIAVLNVLVLRPVQALSEHVARTGRDETVRAEFDDERTDEIGVLGREFDGMTAKLEQARVKLLETARTAGMSEIATGILHNVGNVLNSVNISASLVSQRVDGLCVDDLERLSEVLEENKNDLAGFLDSDPRGQHIQPFLSALVEQLGEEQKTIRGEVASLSDGIDHICELIKSQQTLAKGARIVEPTDLADRMDEALRITQRAQGADPDLVVVRRYDDLPEVHVDKHKLLEILVNLVQNARQAMRASSTVRELALEVKRLDDRRVLLAVQDTGIGIDEETLPHVFAMGFTTREEGHGFGLHSSANAAKEMGGVLRAESDGPGRGARFVLELPMRTEGDEQEPDSAANVAGEAA